MESFNTPVLFLIFNRPDTTQIVFNQIKRVKPKYLYIAADGPRTHVPNENQLTSKTRDIVKYIDWDCNVKYFFRQENLGCKYSVSSSISWFFSNVEEGIILEDDCLPDLSFFYYCQELLNKYRNNTNIAFIGGNCFQLQPTTINESYYFSKYAHIWGWASWRRVWELYDVEMDDYSVEVFNNKIRPNLNLSSETKYWKKIFDLTKDGKKNTWDYQLVYAIWKNNGISITPTKNLVINLGLQNNSTHLFLVDSFKFDLKLDRLTFPLIHPNDVLINKDADKFTFINTFSHSLQRLYRLYRENKVIDVFDYLLKKIF